MAAGRGPRRADAGASAWLRADPARRPGAGRLAGSAANTRRPPRPSAPGSEATVTRAAPPAPGRAAAPAPRQPGRTLPRARPSPAQPRPRKPRPLGDPAPPRPPGARRRSSPLPPQPPAPLCALRLLLCTLFALRRPQASSATPAPCQSRQDRLRPSLPLPTLAPSCHHLCPSALLGHQTLLAPSPEPAFSSPLFRLPLLCC
ncbi:uncharacterized protein LOC131419880 [Diceros bicornis minor]|uniref:uncharacterized protein LOC131419880 n=1 Tax=Diceros bicornis minor TaxID=77932 RepID=UPI0026F278D7|nr:uncharacterized protein LOC131419880 [Diceros bicornis minor]